MKQDPITLAAYHLSILYYIIAYPLTLALAASGVKINHSCPRVVAGQPYDVGGKNAVSVMRDTVASSGTLWVSSDFCEGTIYETASDNHWFRFIHDMGHILYGCEFDYAGETRLHGSLWQWIESCPQFWALTSEQQRWVKAVYLADTQGQTEYFELFGVFPNNQAEFVRVEAERYYNAQA